MDNQATEESVSRDRLSELPNSLIHLILSFLSMREVVSTTILSRRWNDLWTTVPCLKFSDDNVEEEKIRNFVNRALIFWNGTKILKFKISIYDILDLSLAVDVDLWALFAVKNKVEELKIYLHYELDDGIYWGEVMENAYRFPQCLNSCSSIRILSLVGLNIRIHEPPSWILLKSLKIHGYSLTKYSIEQILLGCPILEVFELCLRESYDNLNIMSTSLKRLMIMRHFDSNWYYESLPYYVFRICSPNLEILEFTGELYSKCLLTNCSSLISVTLHTNFHYLCADHDGLCVTELFGRTLRQVLLTGVEKLELSDFCCRCWVKVHEAVSLKKYLPSPLPNVKFLVLGGHHIGFWYIMDLLGIFPNIKVLVVRARGYRMPPDINAVKYLDFETNLPKSFLLKLKTIEIISPYSNIKIFGFIEFFLKHAIRLEKLVFRTKGITTYEQLFQTSEKLLGMPRSSPTAKVVLKNN